MIGISATHLHYIGNTEFEKRHDYCVHGKVSLNVKGCIISGKDEWCVSASALRFMRSVLNDHISGDEEHMIPCCGHFMIASDDKKSVQIVGCTNGIDFDVIHEGGRVLIRIANDDLFSISFSEYKNAVLIYADQIESFMRNSPSRISDDLFDKDGYNAFRNEWHDLKKRIEALD